MPSRWPRRRTTLTTAIIVGAAVAALALNAGLAACSGTGGANGTLDGQQPAGMYTGHGTDDPRVVLAALGDHLDVGVCARKNPESADRSWTAPLVAVPASLLDGNSGCGRQVAVSNADGTTVTATVVGSCSDCAGDDLALSPELFHQLARFGQINGSISLSWQYVS